MPVKMTEFLFVWVLSGLPVFWGKVKGSVGYEKLRAEVFCCALTWGQAPFVRASHPPTPPAESWTGDFWLKPVLVSRHSLNKFRNSLSPLPKYSLQIIQSIVLLFQIVNL